MLLVKKLVATATILATLTLASCADDQESIEEPVQPSATEEPATPPEGSGSGAETVYFAFDDYTLSMDAQDTLNRLAESMKSSGSAVVQIEGHCDERGSIEYNIALGERRAFSVKNHLIQLGIDGSRITTISYGEEKPAVDGHDESAWGKNRRAEFVISGN
jgi:peptidoglycan-associated lipoprotein